MEYAIGMKVEAVNGVKGTIIAKTDAALTVRYKGIGERNVPLDKAGVWLKTPVDTVRTITKSRVGKVPIFIAYAAGDDCVSDLVSYLRASKYRLYASCKPELVGKAEDEYLMWTGGEELPETAIRQYENAYGREWFLTFAYSSNISYPFPIIERGTGGGQGEACGLHKDGRVEVCYWQVIEQLVRAGLRV